MAMVSWISRWTNGLRNGIQSDGWSYTGTVGERLRAPLFCLRRQAVTDSSLFLSQVVSTLCLHPAPQIDPVAFPVAAPVSVSSTLAAVRYPERVIGDADGTPSSSIRLHLEDACMLNATTRPASRSLVESSFLPRGYQLNLGFCADHLHMPVSRQFAAHVDSSTRLFSLPENSPEGTLVGTIQAQDPDGDSLEYHLVGSSPFQLDPISAALRVVRCQRLILNKCPNTF